MAPFRFFKKLNTSLKIKQFSQKGVPLFLFVIILLVVVIIVVVLFRLAGFKRVAVLRCGNRTFDDLVQFAAVEPDAAAFGAVIDLNTVALGHQQVYIAVWALHILNV